MEIERRWNISHLWSRYKLRPYDLRQMLKAQNERCAVCEIELGRVFAIDHDHKCCEGRKSCGLCVRGLLCRRCNVFIGYMESTPASVVERFHLYRKRHIRKRAFRHGRRRKLSPTAIAEIRAERWRTPQRTLAKRFGVSHAAIGKVQREKVASA